LDIVGNLMLLFEANGQLIFYCKMKDYALNVFNN